MTVELTHGGKVYFPSEYITKGEVFTYYDKIAETMLPYLKDRPVTLQRFPEGINDEGFYEKRPMNYFPDRIETVTVPQKTSPESITYMLIHNKDSLLYLVNQGTIAFHRQLATAQQIDKPTHMVFDLDPDESTDLPTLKRGVRAVHDLLEKKKLASELMTTGGNGFHILINLQQTDTYAQVKEQAAQVADELADASPDLFTRAIHKDDRHAPIYLDIQRNNYGQTAICPYSLRAYPGAPVATPVDWEELDHIAPQRYHMRNIFRRLGQKNSEE